MPKTWGWWQPNPGQQQGCTILLGHRAAACPKQNLGVWSQPMSDARQSMEWHSCFQFLPFSWKVGIYFTMADLILCQIPVSTSAWLILRELSYFLHFLEKVAVILLKSGKALMGKATIYDDHCLMVDGIFPLFSFLKGGLYSGYMYLKFFGNAGQVYFFFLQDSQAPKPKS